MHDAYKSYVQKLDNRLIERINQYIVKIAQIIFINFYIFYYTFMLERKLYLCFMLNFNFSLFLKIIKTICV